MRGRQVGQGVTEGLLDLLAASVQPVRGVNRVGGVERVGPRAVGEVQSAFPEVAEQYVSAAVNVLSAVPVCEHAARITDRDGAAGAGGCEAAGERAAHGNQLRLA